MRENNNLFYKLMINHNKRGRKREEEEERDMKGEEERWRES